MRAKSEAGTAWERKFLGFRLNRERRIGAAPESLERFRTKVREKRRSCQSRTSNQLRYAWRQLCGGRLTGNRQPIVRLEGSGQFRGY